MSDEFGQDGVSDEFGQDSLVAASAFGRLDERLVLTFIGDEVMIGAGYYPELKYLSTPPHLPPLDSVYFKNLGKRMQIDELFNETFLEVEKAMETLKSVCDLIKDDMDLLGDDSASDIVEARSRIRNRYYDLEVTWAMINALVDYCFSNDGRELKYSRVNQMLALLTERPIREVLLVGDDGDYSARCNSDILEWETDEEFWGEYWRKWKLEENETLAYRFRCESLFGVCLAIVEYPFLKGTELRRCQYCGKVYFKKSGYSYRYCSETCLKKHNAERVGRYRQSDINKKIGQIRSLVNVRQQWNADKEFADFLYKLRSERKFGYITEQQMLDELTKYHEKIKKRK